MMNNIKPNTHPLEQRHFIVAINFFLVSVMLTCFAFILGKFIQTLYPTWILTGFLPLAFFITLESLITRYTQRTSPQIYRNPFLTAIAEFIMILLIIKIFSMVLAGFSTIWLEIVSWQHDFLNNFFTTDYLIRAFGLMSIWGLSWLFSHPLNQLEEDEKLMEQEKLGYTFTDRLEARRRLISLVFILGFFMIGMLVFMKSEMPLFGYNPTPASTFVAFMLIYFFAAFILLSLNQYAIMKARWYFNEISVNPELPLRWLLYTLAFVLVITVLSFALPTNFTFGLVSIAGIVAQVVMFVFSIIQFIVIFPFALFLTFINAFIDGETVVDQLQQTMPEITPSAPQITSPSSWWELITSVLFWLVLLGLIIFSLFYTLKHRPNLKPLLSKIQISTWLQNFWRWVQQSVNKFSLATTKTIQEGLKNLNSFIQNRKINLPSLADLARRMPPRTAVIMTYLDWIYWNREHGFPRRKSQTPLEYALAYRQILPESSEMINTFTNTFIKARYTNQNIDRAQAQDAQNLLASLKKTFHRKQNEERSLQ
jgi:MFS family permease